LDLEEQLLMEWDEKEDTMPIDINPILLKEHCDYLAPDTSEIYLLANGTHGGLCQCILPVGATSLAVSHKTVEELWYFIEGEGEVWRRNLYDNKPAAVHAGTSIVIPPQTAFQFRNTGTIPLKFIIATLPPWPGAHEAVSEKGFWP